MYKSRISTCLLPNDLRRKKNKPYQRRKEFFCCSTRHRETSMSTCITRCQRFAKEFCWVLARLMAKIRYRVNILLLKSKKRHRLLTGSDLLKMYVSFTRTYSFDRLKTHLSKYLIGFLIRLHNNEDER